MNISTSPYFPFFSALEMNAFLHRKYGQVLWQNAARFAVELRKKILTTCQSVAPLLPRIIDGRLWETYSTEEILSAPRFWQYGESENEKNTSPTHGSTRAKSFSPRTEKDVHTLPCFFPSIFRKGILPLKMRAPHTPLPHPARRPGRKSRGSRFRINGI